MRVFTQVASPRRRREYQFSMVAFSHPLWRFLCLYGALYAGFGVLSPYLPTLLESRNSGPEAIALVLGAGTAIRLIAGPVAGRLADILDAPKAVLAACSVAAALIVLVRSRPASTSIANGRSAATPTRPLECSLQQSATG